MPLDMGLTSQGNPSPTASVTQADHQPSVEEPPSTDLLMELYVLT